MTLSGMRVSWTPLSGVRPFPNVAVPVANTAVRVVDVAGPLAGDDLVGLASLAIEVKDKLESRRQATVPIARQSRPLVPDVEAEAAPALLAHPVEPGMPVRLPFIVPVDETEIDQKLRSAANTPRIRVGDTGANVAW